MWAGGPEAGQNVNNPDAFWAIRSHDQGNEDCVEIFPDGVWADNDCSKEFRSVIEYSCPPGQEFGPTACRSLCRIGELAVIKP